MKKLSIIIPCYNEESTVRELLGRVLGVSLPDWEKEVIVVDDCSKDATRDILREFEDRMLVLYSEKNGGKGTAVRAGLARATGDYAFIQDADLEYNPTDIPALLDELNKGKAQVVYGSRNLSPTTRRGKLIPRLGVWLLTQEVNWLYWLKLTDVWTCYKLFPMEAAHEFVAGRFDSELLFTAALARRGYQFAEVPISYDPRIEGKKITYGDGFITLYRVLLDWLMHPPIFVRVCLVGALGVAIQTLLLLLFVEVFGVHPALGNAIAAEIAIICNFLVNNRWTFRDESRFALPKRFAIFNVSVLGSILIQTAVVWSGVQYFGREWYVLYALLGILVGLVSNYFVYTRVIWDIAKPHENLLHR